MRNSGCDGLDPVKSHFGRKSSTGHKTLELHHNVSMETLGSWHEVFRCASYSGHAVYNSVLKQVPYSSIYYNKVLGGNHSSQKLLRI